MITGCGYVDQNGEDSTEKNTTDGITDGTVDVRSAKESLNENGEVLPSIDNESEPKDGQQESGGSDIADEIINSIVDRDVKFDQIDEEVITVADDSDPRDNQTDKDSELPEENNEAKDDHNDKNVISAEGTDDNIGNQSDIDVVPAEENDPKDIQIDRENNDAKDDPNDENVISAKGAHDSSDSLREKDVIPTEGIMNEDHTLPVTITDLDENLSGKDSIPTDAIDIEISAEEKIENFDESNQKEIDDKNDVSDQCSSLPTDVSSKNNFVRISITNKKKLQSFVTVDPVDVPPQEITVSDVVTVRV